MSEEASPHTYRLNFSGSAGPIFGIFVRNVFLTLVTFGVYYFWGKTRVRAYLFGQTSFADDRFAYHGTGAELFKGFLKGLVIFGLPLFVLDLLGNVASLPTGIRVLAGLLSLLLVLTLSGVAVVAAHRYRLSRTSWRAIRFSFRGGIREFVRLFLTGTLLTGVTLGFYYPVFFVRQMRFLIARSSVGNQRFQFDGSAAGLVGPYLLAIAVSAAVIVIVPFPTSFLQLLIWAFGLIVPWTAYLVKQQTYVWNHTSLGNAHFRLNIEGMDYFALKFGNLLLLVLTLGLGWPWVSVRNVRFMCTHLTLTGVLDFAAIEQDARAATATGEGLADLFGVDADVGIG